MKGELRGFVPLGDFEHGNERFEVGGASRCAGLEAESPKPKINQSGLEPSPFGRSGPQAEDTGALLEPLVPRDELSGPKANLNPTLYLEPRTV